LIWIATDGRYGYRRVTAMLNDSGMVVGKDRVQRIWRREGLKVPQKQPKRARLWLNDGSCIRLRPEHPNDVWSFDFVEAQTHDGRRLRLMTLIDEFTRKCLAIRVARRINAIGVIETLADAMLFEGVPAFIRSDNGPEMVARVLRQWLSGLGTKSLYIEPGSPWENSYYESSMANSAMNASMAKSSIASRKPKWSSSSGASTTTREGHTQPSDTARQRPSPSHCYPHSTEPQTCNSLSLRLVQNVGQANLLEGVAPHRLHWRCLSSLDFSDYLKTARLIEARVRRIGVFEIGSRPIRITSEQHMIHESRAMALAPIGRIGCDERQMPARLNRVYLIHDVEDLVGVFQNILCKSCFKMCHETVAIRVGVRRQPQGCSTAVCHAERGFIVKCCPAEEPQNDRKIFQVTLRLRIEPSHHRVGTKSQSKDTDNVFRIGIAPDSCQELPPVTRDVAAFWPRRR
jgi:transposase InsO family protein